MERCASIANRAERIPCSPFKRIFPQVVGTTKLSRNEEKECVAKGGGGIDVLCAESGSSHTYRSSNGSGHAAEPFGKGFTCMYIQYYSCLPTNLLPRNCELLWRC
jgi:hypothetical protein